MAYTEPVSKVNDEIYTVDAFNDNVVYGNLGDYDGFGHPVFNGLADFSIQLDPSDWEENIPLDATHVVWYNK